MTIHTTIAVIDDHPIVRCGLIKVLSSKKELTVVGEGSSGQDAINIAREKIPDVLFLDINMPGDGMVALEKIVTSHSNTKCIIFTMSDCSDTAIKALNLGARGYILKGASAEDLLGAVATVRDNSSYISPDFANRLLRAAQTVNATPSKTNGTLNLREEQVINGVADGKTNREIAEDLGLCEKTVKHYMSNVMSKYGVANRVAALVAHQRASSTQPNNTH